MPTNCQKSAIVIFADNVAAHKADFALKILEDHLNFLNNTPYSAMMNLIENFFSKFKYMIKKHTCNTDRQIILAVQDTLDSFVLEDFNDYTGDMVLYDIYIDHSMIKTYKSASYIINKKKYLAVFSEFTLC